VRRIHVDRGKTPRRRSSTKRRLDTSSDTGEISPVLTKRRALNGSVLSPNASTILDQDNSFFNNCIDEIIETEQKYEKSRKDSEDIFAISEDECSPPKVEGHQGDGDKHEESQTISSLPLSVLDLRSRILEETKPSQPTQKQLIRKPKLLNEHVVAEHCDRGPFFGLPDRVRQLYREVKGITELFPWQNACLNSEAVQAKKNLLYSLPTSGGKTLVAEIIMLQELICYRKNCIFVLPYVSLVQEKIRSLAPFALELGFYLEEYAGNRGRFPPQKRRHKQSLFVCTIEKAHALFNSLLTEKRVNEVGLLVIDEVHMIGEDTRGVNLESLIAKLKYINSTRDDKVQMISMSATVGNLRELSQFLDSELYTDSWRPVTLQEYVKVGKDVFTVHSQEVDPFKINRQIDISNYSTKMKQIDEDYLTSLVMEVYPEHSCLVFCDTKKRCENVAEMLCKMIYNQAQLAEKVLGVKKQERKVLQGNLLVEGSGYMCPVLRKTIQFGVAYHHSGLTSDERKVIEEGFLTGAVGVLCCTSTLAAGVNLPARRVIIRSPFMGRNQLTHTQYKQMIGRAGRAGLDTHGESFLMVKPSQVKLVADVVTSPVEHCITSLHKSGSLGIASLVLNCMHLGLVGSAGDAKRILGMSLLAIQSSRLNVKVEQSLSIAIDTLFKNNLITVENETASTQQKVELDTPIKTTRLGRATVQGNIKVDVAGRLFSDLRAAQPRLAVDTCLHLLYLLTPYELETTMFYDSYAYHKIYMSMDDSDLAVAKFLGITESVMIGLLTGRGCHTALKPTLTRFYLALVLLDLWNVSNIHDVAEKFCLSRGDVQNLMASAASFSNSVLSFCLEIEEFWAYQELLEPFTKRLAHCCSPELLPLLELPAVKAGRAKQLLQAGFSSLASIAKVEPRQLVDSLPNLSFKTAQSIVMSAKLILIDKAEGLQDEADSVLVEIS